MKRQRRNIGHRSRPKTKVLANAADHSNGGIRLRRRTIHSVPSVRIPEANLALVEAWSPTIRAPPYG